MTAVASGHAFVTSGCFDGLRKIILHTLGASLLDVIRVVMVIRRWKVSFIFQNPAEFFDRLSGRAFVEMKYFGPFRRISSANFRFTSWIAARKRLTEAGESTSNVDSGWFWKYAFS